MHKYVNNEGTYYFGPTSEIKSLYKSVRRAVFKGNTTFDLISKVSPIYSKKKAFYAVLFKNNGQVQLLTSDKMLSVLYENC